MTGTLSSVLAEVSGLAVSTRDGETLWMINDSGNSAELFAVRPNGQVQRAWTLGAANIDWEDLASYWINGESYLFIADIGNNLQVRTEQLIYIVREPIAAENTTSLLAPVNTIRFHYADGPHNAEALAISSEWIYILSKEPTHQGSPVSSQVYRIPLTLDSTDTSLTAEPVGMLATSTQSLEAKLIAALTGVDIGQPTALDFDLQNRNAYVLTYRHILRYTRHADESWESAFARTGEVIFTHDLKQAEALAVAADGVVWITSE